MDSEVDFGALGSGIWEGWQQMLDPAQGEASSPSYAKDFTKNPACLATSDRGAADLRRVGFQMI